MFCVPFSLLLSILLRQTVASSLFLIATPKAIRFASTAPLHLNDIPLLNSQMLGLSTKTAPGFLLDTDLYQRPQALAVFVIDVPVKIDFNASRIALLPGELASDWLPFLNDSSLTNSRFVQISSQGIKWSSKPSHLYEDSSFDPPQIQSENMALRTEMQQIDRFVDSIGRVQGGLLSAGPDIINVQIRALRDIHPTSADYLSAVADVRDSIEEMKLTLSEVYGAGNVILEVVCMEGGEDERNELRSVYKVQRFSREDDRAIFLIFVTVVVIMFTAVLFATFFVLADESMRFKVMPSRGNGRLKID